MTSQDAGRRGEEYMSNHPGEWFSRVQVIGMLAQHADAAVAEALAQDRIARAHAATVDMEAYAAGQVEEAVKERDAEIERLMIIIDGLREGEHEARHEARAELAREVFTVSQGQLELCSTPCRQGDCWGCDVTRVLMNAVNGPPASAPEGEP